MSPKYSFDNEDQGVPEATSSSDSSDSDSRSSSSSNMAVKEEASTGVSVLLNDALGEQDAKFYQYLFQNNNSKNDHGRRKSSSRKKDGETSDNAIRTTPSDKADAMREKMLRLQRELEKERQEKMRQEEKSLKMAHSSRDPTKALEERKKKTLKLNKKNIHQVPDKNVDKQRRVVAQTIAMPIITPAKEEVAQEVSNRENVLAKQRQLHLSQIEAIKRDHQKIVRELSAKVEQLSEELLKEKNESKQAVARLVNELHATEEKRIAVGKELERLKETTEKLAKVDNSKNESSNQKVMQVPDLPSDRKKSAEAMLLEYKHSMIAKDYQLSLERERRIALAQESYDLKQRIIGKDVDIYQLERNNNACKATIAHQRQTIDKMNCSRYESEVLRNERDEYKSMVERLQDELRLLKQATLCESMKHDKLTDVILRQNDEREKELAVYIEEKFRLLRERDNLQRKLDVFLEKESNQNAEINSIEQASCKNIDHSMHGQDKDDSFVRVKVSEFESLLTEQCDEIQFNQQSVSRNTTNIAGPDPCSKEDLRAELDRLFEKLATNVTNRKFLESQNDQLEKDRDTNEIDQVRLLRERNSLERKLEASQSELLQSKKENLNLDEYKAKVEKMENELDSLREQLSRNKISQMEADELATVLQCQNDQLEKKLTANMEEKLFLLKEKENLQLRLNESQEELSKYQEHNKPELKLAMRKDAVVDKRSIVNTGEKQFAQKKITDTLAHSSPSNDDDHSHEEHLKDKKGEIFEVDLGGSSIDNTHPSLEDQSCSSRTEKQHDRTFETHPSLEDRPLSPRDVPSVPSIKQSSTKKKMGVDTSMLSEEDHSGMFFTELEALAKAEDDLRRLLEEDGDGSFIDESDARDQSSLLRQSSVVIEQLTHLMETTEIESGHQAKKEIENLSYLIEGSTDGNGIQGGCDVKENNLGELALLNASPIKKIENEFGNELGNCDVSVIEPILDFCTDNEMKDEVLTSLENNPIVHHVFHTLLSRCEALEQERTDILSETLDLLDISKESHRVEMEAALAATRREAAQKIAAIEEEGQQNISLLHSKFQDEMDKQRAFQHWKALVQTETCRVRENID